jgi:hypothetical protein
MTQSIDHLLRDGIALNIGIVVEDPGSIKIDNFFACIAEIVFGKGGEL